MTQLQRSPLHGIILGLLAVLVATNVTLLILLRKGGPLIGLIFYLILLAITVRARHGIQRMLLAGGLVGLAVHVVEVVVGGWPDYPMLMMLNLVLPAGLAMLAGVADRLAHQENRNR